MTTVWDTQVPILFKLKKCSHLKKNVCISKLYSGTWKMFQFLEKTFSKNVLVFRKCLCFHKLCTFALHIQKMFPFSVFCDSKSCSCFRKLFSNFLKCFCFQKLFMFSNLFCSFKKCSRCKFVWYFQNCSCFKNCSQISLFYFFIFLLEFRAKNQKHEKRKKNVWIFVVFGSYIIALQM